MSSPKLIRLESVPFAGADFEEVRVWQAAIPKEESPLQFGLVNFEYKERDFDKRS